MRSGTQHRWLLVLGLVGAMTARAAEGDAVSDKARREQLDAQRSAAEARYERAVRECERGFVVTSCVDKAKAERRATLDRISREQMAIDDAQRKRRADERRQRIAEKQAQQALRGGASAPEAEVRAPRATPAPASSPKPGRRIEQRPAEEEAAAQAEAARRAAQSQERRERAQAHAEAVRQRNAERAAQRPPAAPLPAPGASAASAIR
ncbi:MAG TPA: hypothetical protein VMT83_09505 [Burkholderiaceae bacterium]|nr:hypothetical protein [Burkholderiaceae bacterium]